MWLIVDFGNKANKAKKKSLEDKMVSDIIETYDTRGLSTVEKQQLELDKLSEMRKRRNKLDIDPLAQRRNQQPGTQKILAPYNSPFFEYLPKWDEKQNRGKYGNYTGIVNSPLQSKANTINTKLKTPTLPTQPTQSVKPKIEHSSVPFYRKQPAPPPPVITSQPSEGNLWAKNKLVVTPTKSASRSTPTVKNHLGRNLTIGTGVGLGLIGASLYLKNRQNNNQNT